MLRKLQSKFVGLSPGISEVKKTDEAAISASRLCARTSLKSLTPKDSPVGLSVFVMTSPNAIDECRYSPLRAGLVISRLRTRFSAGVAGECSYPELTFCADSYSVFVPPQVTAAAHKRPRSFCEKCKWQVALNHAHTLDPTKSEWANCRCPGIMREPIEKRAHAQLARERSATVVSAR